MPKLTQEQLLEIFNALKKEMKPYEKGSIVARFDMEGKYDLWSEFEGKGLEIYGRMRKEVAFAALIIQSGYVGFYFMPVYADDNKIKEQLSPELLKLLKGKACFHIKEVNKNILKYVKDALKVGYAGYKKLGWVK